jgi:hypothetical protein
VYKCHSYPKISFDVFRCLVCRRLVFFRLAGPFQAGKGYPVFAGRRYQRGHGLGSIFGGLFKAALPLLKKGAKTLGREALKTGLNIAGDVVQGRNIKQARLKSTGQNLFQKAMDTISFDVFRCLVCPRLVFFRLAGPFIARCPGGSTVSIAFWNKFCPDTRSIVPFERGRVVVTLHCRKRKEFSLE